MVGAPAAIRHDRSRWPARLDVIQALSGLLLVLFVWCHMVLESSILLGKDAMYRVARFMEGRYLLARIMRRGDGFGGFIEVFL